VDDATKKTIRDRIADLRKAMETSDLEAIRKSQDELMKASHSLAEMMYKKAASAGAGEETKGEGPEKGQDDVIDAEFKDVK